ncbi:MAG: isopentenyl-diphosphate Delta-isomerase [Pseudomonadota bacterium]
MAQSHALAYPDPAAHDHLLLVDEEDRVVGTEEKLLAHRQGVLHRAFSVMIYDDADRWLLQRRAPVKYHSAGLWTNACCGHPRPGEDTKDAASRRLREELSFTCPLTFLTKIRYRSELDQGLTEHELVSVFMGRHQGEVRPNPDEADRVRWIDARDLRLELERNAADFTVWFRKYVDELWAPLAAGPSALERP